MKKICYTVTLPGTIEAFFIPQLLYIASLGFDVTVVCSSSSKLQAQLGDKVHYHAISIPRGISASGSVSAIVKLVAFFRKEQFDLVQYSTPNAAFYASIAARIAGCKVRNYHMMGFRYLGASGIGRVILKWVEKITCDNSTSIECVSKSNLEIGVREGIFSREKATVVWNGSTGGVDLKRFDYGKRSEYRDEIRKKYGLLGTDFVFGFVGRITRDKGINEILEAFSCVDNAKLMIVGTPESIETLDQQLYQQSLHNPNITYTGSVSDVEKYFAAIDVLLLPSYREGFGNVVIEAAAMGTPAIVSDIPGPVDTIDPGRTALVIPVKDAEALQAAMIQIRMLDYVGMGECAAKFVKENFDSDFLCKKILERKHSLLSGENCI